MGARGLESAVVVRDAVHMLRLALSARRAGIRPYRAAAPGSPIDRVFFFKQKTAYEIGLGIPAEPLFRSGFHKQMDNRIKLLEEILSFRMQGVEFDNGDMYVDGHKAASDVRDEFVSVTEKLMDELAQCYNVLPQLDINNTIDHRPEG